MQPNPDSQAGGPDDQVERPDDQAGHPDDQVETQAEPADADVTEPVDVDVTDAAGVEVTDAAGVEVSEVEVLDALPVVSREHGLTLGPALLPAVQTAAAAATGFVVGAATLALLRRRDARRLARDVRDLRERFEPFRRPSQGFPMEPGRSYLVHVRVLSRPPVPPQPPLPPRAPLAPRPPQRIPPPQRPRPPQSP